ncbi:hypothetical protein XELAEV_18017425mg [Xenopus laevis]|uniref:Uncharacterized protein n=1 Tax=Xenopus laevis TaxID=8355 RepID=A0A974DBB6_XENLA|nr:hypothetical protein XELAEV_18017425mg [Xenopus laevis]
MSGFSRRELHVSAEIMVRSLSSNCQWNGSSAHTAPSPFHLRLLTVLARQWMVGAAVQHQEERGIPTDSLIIKGMANSQPSSCCTAIATILPAAPFTHHHP